MKDKIYEYMLLDTEEQGWLEELNILGSRGWKVLQNMEENLLLERRKEHDADKHG